MNEEILKEYLGDNYLIICGSVILILLVIIYKVVFSKKRSKARKNLLICGPNNSGKTSFFYNVSINSKSLFLTKINCVFHQLISIHFRI